MYRHNFIKTKHCISRYTRTTTRVKSSLSSTNSAVILGCYEHEDKTKFVFTKNGKLVDDLTKSKLTISLEISNFKAEVGKTRTFFGLHQDYPCITVTGLGEESPIEAPNEDLDEKKENIRTAIGAAASLLNGYDYQSIQVDSCGDAVAAAEGGFLSVHSYDELKSKKKNKVNLEVLNPDDNELMDWRVGQFLSASQNYARDLMEMPSNYKAPLMFAEMAANTFSSYSTVDVKIRNKDWAKEMKMNSFLSVGEGSVNTSIFLEVHYTNSDQSPIVLVGKGITFDSGGISIKPSNNMGEMRGDMGGAACVLGCLKAVADLELPVNLVALIPLAENLPSGSATKPGDVVRAMNGKTIEVDNTDAEGRLVLADALCYSSHFQPSHVINAATLTGAIDVAIGAGATGAYTTCNDLWATLHQAGMTTGDRMWRMPLFKYYTKQMECSKTADLRNTQKKARSAGSPTAAAFLKEFVTTNNWAHLDIAGVMSNEGDVPYLPSGMSGRPTRTLVETVRILAGNKLVEKFTN